MRLRSMGEMAEPLGLRGTIGLELPGAPDAEDQRRLRLEYARGNRRWTEIEATELVRRGPYLVHADTGRLYQHRRHVFAGDTPTSPINGEDEPLLFWVAQDGETVFVGEPSSDPRTIEELVERQAQREAGGSSRR